MRHITLTLLTVTFGLSCGLVAAAGKSVKAERVVETVLQQESHGTVSRRADELGSAIEDSDRARWAAGYVRTGDGWQMYDLPVAVDERVRVYQQRRGTAPLSLDENLALGEWCREQKLLDQYRAHLWAALVQSPRAIGLWQRLGYEPVNGTWMTKDERRRAEQEQRDLEKGYRKWTPRAQNLATRLADGNLGAQDAARSELNTVDDLQALPALESHLAEASADAATSLVDWLRQRTQTRTTLALVRQSVASPYPAVRTKAMEALATRRLDHSMPPLLYALSTPASVAVVQTSQPGAGNNLLMTTMMERETWKTIERRNFAVWMGPQLDISIGRRTGLIRTSWHAWRPTTREQNDLQRLQTDINRNLREFSQNLNQQIESQNERVTRVLSHITGTGAERTPEEWWSSWSAFTETEAPTTKNVVEVSESEVVPADSSTVSTHSSCLPAGTIIRCSTGATAIESLRVGDRVLAKNINTGELAYKPVLRTTVRSAQPLVTLHTKDDSIRATRGHYFWVSGQGWRMAKEIKPGDRLHGVQGTVTVTDVGLGGLEPVYNLVVEDANSYFVGKAQILSHDVTTPVPTDVIVPGLAAR